MRCTPLLLVVFAFVFSCGEAEKKSADTPVKKAGSPAKISADASAKKSKRWRSFEYERAELNIAVQTFFKEKGKDFIRHELSPSQIRQLDALLSAEPKPFLDSIQSGLACKEDQHRITFWQGDRPVARVNLSFLCSRHYISPEASNPDLEQLSKLITSWGFPVFSQYEEHKAYYQKVYDKSRK